MAKEEEEYVDRGDVVTDPDLEEELDDEEVTDLDEEELEDEDSDGEGDQDDDDDDDSDESDDSDDDSDDEVEEDEEDEEDDEEDEVADDDDDRGNRIPRGRLNKVLRQRDEERELRQEQAARMEWLEKQLESMIQGQTVKKEADTPEPDPYDFDSAEEQYIEHILAGETKEAIALRKQITEARNTEYQQQVKVAKEAAAEEAFSKAESTRDEERFQMLLEDITEEYSFFDDDSDDYNEKAVRMANNLMATYLHDGKSKSMALKLAVEDIIPYFETREDEKPVKRKAVKRKTQARRKAAKASNQQPPATRGVRGKREKGFDAADIANMPEKEFAKLTAREKAKARGDLL